MDTESFLLLAERAARLLPPAPPSGDTLAWMSWRELIWETARRLGAVGAHLLDTMVVVAEDCGDEISFEQLLNLTILLHRDSNECAAVTTQASARD